MQRAITADAACVAATRLLTFIGSEESACLPPHSVSSRKFSKSRKMFNALKSLAVLDLQGSNWPLFDRGASVLEFVCLEGAWNAG